MCVCVCACASQSVHGWDRREKKEEDGEGHECIANITRYLFCLDGGAVWFERISIELLFHLYVCCRVTLCIRTYVCVCGYEDSQPMIDILDEASKTWGLKSFLNPVRRLNSLSNIGRALLYFFFFFFQT